MPLWRHNFHIGQMIFAQSRKTCMSGHDTAAASQALQGLWGCLDTDRYICIAILIVNVGAGQVTYPVRHCISGNAASPKSITCRIRATYKYTWWASERSDRSFNDYPLQCVWLDKSCGWFVAAFCMSDRMADPGRKTQACTVIENERDAQPLDMSNLLDSEKVFKVQNTMCTASVMQI